MGTVSEDAVPPAEPEAGTTEVDEPRPAWLAEHAKNVLYPAIGLIGLVVCWALVVAIFDIREYLVPSPRQVWDSFVDHRGLLWSAALVTGREVIAGFALAVLVGVPIGIVLGESRLAQRFFYPLLVMGQIVPKVAIGPLMVVWFGFGLTSKVFFVLLMSFFPMVLNTMVGVSQASDDFRRLARAVGLGRFSTLFKVTLPQALPSIFAGLKLGITLAVIGAVVAEFITSQAGLGFLILVAQGQVDTPLLFAAIFTLTLLGFAFYAIVALIERLVTPWKNN